jgi:hypothetical protein
LYIVASRQLVRGAQCPLEYLALARAFHGNRLPRKWFISGCTARAARRPQKAQLGREGRSTLRVGFSRHWQP